MFDDATLICVVMAKSDTDFFADIMQIWFNP